LVHRANPRGVIPPAAQRTGTLNWCAACSLHVSSRKPSFRVKFAEPAEAVSAGIVPRQVPFKNKQERMSPGLEWVKRGQGRNN